MIRCPLKKVSFVKVDSSCRLTQTGIFPNVSDGVRTPDEHLWSLDNCKVSHELTETNNSSFAIAD